MYINVMLIYGINPLKINKVFCHVDVVTRNSSILLFFFVCFKMNW